jgi:long-chain fatty acid transport protein
MKRKIFLITFSFLVFLGVSSLVRGGGFLIYEHGAAAMAMGGAFVAIANNPTAVFHNPAGIAWLEGTQVSVGTTLIMPKATLDMPYAPLINPAYSDSYEAKKQLFYPSTAYITHKLSDKIVAGFGFFSPYGLGTEWSEPNAVTFPLRYLSTKDDMKTFVFNPVIAYKVSDKFSLGVGVAYIRSTIKFNLVQAVDLRLYGGSIYEVPTSITDGKGSGWGWNAGALFKGEKVSLGLNFRSGFKIDFTGDITLDRTNVPTTPISPTLTLRDLVPTGGSVATSFNFPSVFCAGVAFSLTPKLLLSADINYVFWNTYDKFDIAIDFPAPYPDQKQTFLENWDISTLFRAGVQYQLNEKLALRGGFLYDQTPQPTDTMDPILPDADRMAFTAGFGYKVGKFVIDVAGQYEIFSDRTSPNRKIAAYQVGGMNLGEGTYSTKALLIGISLGFVF